MKTCYLVSAAAKFQFHMIARLDDTCRFEFKDLKTHPQLSFALLARMCWSKNVCVGLRMQIRSEMLQIK